MTTAPATPRGILFFVHGANETSEGLSGHVSRIEDIRSTVRAVEREWEQELGADRLDLLRELLRDLNGTRTVRDLHASGGR